ncbi:unnamed protein product [Somion occarium]|uniref:Uncharacterized protein n=1 Tax=Somion occarium TaxID=3059160 RepID=A0ABP1CVB5_9APHY
MMRSFGVLLTVIFVGLPDCVLSAATGSVKCKSNAADTAFLARCHNNRVQARLPPTINPDPKSSICWVPPPPGWFYGNWKMTYSSEPSYLHLHNMHSDTSPVFPQSSKLPGQNNDVVSYQIANSTTILTEHTIDTPRRSKDPSLGPEWDAVYDTVGTGNMAAVNNTWELLAWGYDTCGDGYLVIYETATPIIRSPSGLDIESRSENGPSPETLADIFVELLALNNTELSELVKGTVKQVVDGRRWGMSPVECDAHCVNNTGVSA